STTVTTVCNVDMIILSRVLRPPGGGSNISFGADEEKPPVRKNKMASSVFAEPEDPYANRRNNPPAEQKSKGRKDKFGTFVSGVLKITARLNCSSAFPAYSKSQRVKYIRMTFLFSVLLLNTTR
uniref:Uncharacterized protein n=1 Tax=Anabas testudineus TaxID=64144 RepID=A0A3Q1HDP5_ANATE